VLPPEEIEEEAGRLAGICTRGPSVGEAQALWIGPTVVPTDPEGKWVGPGMRTESEGTPQAESLSAPRSAPVIVGLLDRVME
jgi:hypothetical protein